MISYPRWSETLNMVFFFPHACTHAKYIYTLNWLMVTVENLGRDSLFLLVIFQKNQQSNCILFFTYTVVWLIIYCTNLSIMIRWDVPHISELDSQNLVVVTRGPWDVGIRPPASDNGCWWPTWWHKMQLMLVHHFSLSLQRKMKLIQLWVPICLC
jgi:hypothetical protein